MTQALHVPPERTTRWSAAGSGGSTATASIQLAAQTLQSFFTGGGTAREHAEYPLAEVALLAPVLHPPSVRVFDDQTSFAFANPTAIVGPGRARSSGRRRAVACARGSPR